MRTTVTRQEDEAPVSEFAEEQLVRRFSEGPKRAMVAGDVRYAMPYYWAPFILIGQ